MLTPRWRIRLVAYGARLESVLGSRPRGFESPILRRWSRVSRRSGHPAPSLRLQLRLQLAWSGGRPRAVLAVGRWLGGGPEQSTDLLCDLASDLRAYVPVPSSH